MTFEAKNFDNILGINGFSDTMLKNHFTLYQGYVANTNKLEELLRAVLQEGKTTEPAYTEAKRRVAWEFNGMRLHELYFENMTKSANVLDKHSALFKKINEDLGFEVWERAFRATGSMRGIGWTVMYYDPASGHIYNAWINEHDAGHLCGAIPLLVMDVFEHAYMTDYGIKRADYIEAFMKAIDWQKVAERYIM